MVLASRILGVAIRWPCLSTSLTSTAVLGKQRGVLLCSGCTGGRGWRSSSSLSIRLSACNFHSPAFLSAWEMPISSSCSCAVERPDLEPGAPALGKSCTTREAQAVWFQERQAFDTPTSLWALEYHSRRCLSTWSSWPLLSWHSKSFGSLGVKEPVVGTAGSLRACN